MTPIVLEVHPAIQVPGIGTADRLPGYVPRVHDTRLREIADQVITDQTSQLVTLVAGSSTGKTRACWELGQYLEQRQPGRWWLWHPYDPTRPDATLAALDQVGPDTIVWLNEAQHYLMSVDAGLGERIAAGLRTLLNDPQRRPVLVLATMWPQYWDALTTRPTKGPDPYEQARKLLTSTAVTVTATFAPGELAALTDPSVDPRLRHAAEHAEHGRITQYLAGAPELETRYRTAPPAARAIIQVAMDARRLGHPLALPYALLESAAPGYLDDHDWDALGEDWLEQALAYTARPAKGARGPLTRIRTRPGEPSLDSGQSRYRLADYLEQLGRTERAAVYPPGSLWTAFTTTLTDPDVLGQLGAEAEGRGRYQHAIWLYLQAADCGDAGSLRELATLRARAAGAADLYGQAVDRGDTEALRYLAWPQKPAADASAETLALRAADSGDTSTLDRDALGWLTAMRHWAGDIAGAEALAPQAADRGDIDRGTPGWLAAMRQWAGGIAPHAAEHGQHYAPTSLAWLRERVGDPAGAEALYLPAADRGDTGALMSMARLREQAGDRAGAEALAVQALENKVYSALESLALVRKRDGDLVGAEALYLHAANRGHLGALWKLAELRRQEGDSAGADRVWKFGLDEWGQTSTALDFSPLRPHT